MSVEFNNAYQETLFENLTSVIKQNIIFQTQLKLNEQLQQQIEQLTKQNSDLSDQCKNLENYKKWYEQNAFSVEEKNRIQQALNETMQKNNDLNLEIENNKKHLKELKEQLSKFTKEKNTDSKEKKEDKKVETLTVKSPKIKNVIKHKESDFVTLKKVNDGSSFWPK